MMIAIDTTRYVDFARGEANAVNRLRTAERNWCR